MDDQETKADIPRKTAREELFRARNNEGQRFDREHHVLETLELVIKQMDAAVTRCSHDLRYLWANQGYADWIKRPLNEIVGHPIVDVLGKEAFEHLQHHFVRVLTGHRVHYEEEVSFQGIGQRWISATYTPTLNPDGAANGWVAVVLDITERKRVEGELRRSEARLVAEADALAKLDDLSSRLWQLSSLQEGLSEMLAAVVGLLGADKANVQLLDAERGVLNIVAQYGFEQPFLDFFREVSIADQSACGRSLCSGCRIVVEDIETDEAYAPLRAIARASDYRAVTSTPLVRSDGSILGMLSTHFKSPHRPTEESLLRLDLYARQAAGFVQQCKAKRVLSQRYAAIVESSDDAIISKNLNAVIVTWNAGAQRLFGYTDAETIGQPITILIPPELRDEENKILEKLRTGECIEHYETVRVTNTGKRINVSLTISPMRDSTGKIVGFSKIARDISERKRTDEALRASEERLRLAQQAARIGTFEWNIRTGANTWTPELEAMYGLAPRGFGGTQTAFENLVHPDDRARVIELDNWALKTGQPTTGEWRVVWPDGSVHWIAGRWQVYMNEAGQPARMVGVNIDISDHKLAQEELSKANERNRLALEAGSAGGWDYDLKTGKDVWFGTAHAQLGMTPDETSGSRNEFWDRVHEDDRKRVAHALQTAKDKREEFAEDVRVVWRDGTTHWLRARGRFQYSANGEAERSLGISLDITERKMAEDRLREYEEAVEGAEDILGVVDREYRLLLANRQYLRMRNMTREQVVGRFVPDVLGKELFETIIKPKLDECFRG